MDIKQLRYFVAIVEEGSFSKAARRVRIAQPALSLQVRKMEESLQTELLLRWPHGIEPTEAGKVLLTRARLILNDLSQVEAEIRSFGREPTGTVRLGLPATISGILSVPLIAQVRNKYPSIKIIIAEAMSGFVSEWLQQGNVDLAVLYTDKQHPGTAVKKLVREELVVLIPPAAKEDCLTVEEALADMPLILPSNAHGLRIMLEQKMRDRTVEINPEIEIDSYSNIKHLVAGGYGCSILPFHAVSRDMEEGKIACIRFEDKPLWRSAHLVYTHGRPLTQAVKAVQQEIESVVDKLIAEKAWAGAERL